MKKKIVALVLTLLMAFAFVGCTAKPAEEPITYSDTLIARIATATELDAEEVSEKLMPAFLIARMNEKKINDILDYVDTNMAGAMELAPGFVDPSTLDEAAIAAMKTLFTGARAILSDDDIGKFLYGFIVTNSVDIAAAVNEASELEETDEDIITSAELKAMAEKLTIDNFVVISRLIFKVLDKTAEKSVAVAENAFDFISETATAAEMFTAFKAELTAFNDIYNVITDDDINKIIEIAITMTAPETATAAEVTSVITETKATVAKGRKAIKFILDAANSVTDEQFNEIMTAVYDEDFETIVTSVCDILLTKYDALSAGDKTAVNEFLSEMVTLLLMQAGEIDNGFGTDFMGTLEELSEGGEAAFEDFEVLFEVIYGIYENAMGGSKLPSEDFQF